MTHIKILGVDIAKDVFQLCGINRAGKIIYKKRVKRDQYVQTVANLNVDRVVMEACGGANHWHRTFSALGISTQLISAQHVKPFVKSNKNDRNDAHAIAEAASRPTMPVVAAKSLEQQDVQALLKVRARLIKARTSLLCEIRGLLQEYGITIPRAAHKVYQQLPGILDDQDSGLTVRIKAILNRLYVELLNRDEEIGYYEKE